jgi:hypothetical protein
MLAHDVPTDVVNHFLAQTEHLVDIVQHVVSVDVAVVYGIF